MNQGLTPEEYRNKFLSVNCLHYLLIPSVFYLKGIVESIQLILNQNYRRQALLLIVYYALLWKHLSYTLDIFGKILIDL